MQPLLGTFVAIRVAGADERVLGTAINQAFAAITRVQLLMSAHDATSELARIHNAAPGTRVTIDPWTHTVLGEALQLARCSRGVFDPTVASALLADGLLPDLATHTPSDLGTWTDIELDSPETVRCHRPLRIDLGGIAKGFAVDRAVEALIAAGIPQGMVNAGGDMRVFGEQAVPIHLRHPAAAERHAPLVMLCNEAIASSAPTFSRQQHGERWISALRDGRNGASQVRPLSVSIRAATCCHADGLTKVLMADSVIADPVFGCHVLNTYHAQAIVFDAEHIHTDIAAPPRNPRPTPDHSHDAVA